MFKQLVIVMLLLSFEANAIRLKYNELQIKDYDEMSNMVNNHIQRAKEVAIEKQQEGDVELGDQLAIDELAKAMTLIFARPDKDNMAAKLLPAVKKELMNYNAYDETLDTVASDAIQDYRNKKLPVVMRATSIFVLENLMSEIRPQLKEKDEFRSIVEKIRSAKLKVSKDIRNHRKLTGMYNTTSPSETAKKLLKPLKNIYKQ